MRLRFLRTFLILCMRGVFASLRDADMLGLAIFRLCVLLKPVFKDCSSWFGHVSTGTPMVIVVIGTFCT